MRPVHTLALLLAAGPPAAAQVPQAIPDEWRPAFLARPGLTEPGVYAVDKPQKALLVTGRFAPAEPLTDTARNRQLGRDRAESAAYAVLYAHFYERDKSGLVVPERLKRFADEAVLRDAHRRTLTVRGAKALAVWTDPKGVCCTLLVPENGVTAAEFAPAFRAAAGDSRLRAFEADPKPDPIRTAFECDPASPAVRTAYSALLARRGLKVAASLLSSPSAKPPDGNAPPDASIRTASETAFKKAVAAFEQPKPDLEAALDGFLAALEGRPADPDCLNYAGVCYRSMGYPGSARVFLDRAVAGGPHRLATTNLGLTLLDLGNAAEARKTFGDAVKHFPNEPWTAKAREAVRRLDGPTFRDVEIEPPFSNWLTARPELMETAGVKVFKLGGARYGLVAVAAVPLKDGSAADILRAERVAREKALRSLIAKESGLTVASVQVFEQRTAVRLADGKPKATSLAEYLEWTQAKVEGVGKDLPVVGRWKSENRDVLYLATGVVCDGKN